MNFCTNRSKAVWVMSFHQLTPLWDALFLSRFIESLPILLPCPFNYAQFKVTYLSSFNLGLRFFYFFLQHYRGIGLRFCPPAPSFKSVTYPFLLRKIGYLRISEFSRTCLRSFEGSKKAFVPTYIPFFLLFPFCFLASSSNISWRLSKCNCFAINISSTMKIGRRVKKRNHFGDLKRKSCSQLEFSGKRLDQFSRRMSAVFCRGLLLGACVTLRLNKREITLIWRFKLY